MAKAKFVVRKGTTGKFRFILIGTNGRVIATSEAYESKASAMRGIEALRKHASDARVMDETAKDATKAPTTKRGKAAGITQAAKLIRERPTDPSTLTGAYPGGSQPL
jgi:uncharacterized protein YegP (UPF0339 family)